VNDYTVVVNAGSSSLKFSVFRRTDADSWKPDVRGQIEGLGTRPIFSARNGASEPVFTTALDRSVADARGALAFVANWLRERYGGAHVSGVGHRVVHGGAKYTGPIVVTPEVLEDLRTLIPLASLHQPYNIAAIDAVWERLPGVRQVACFDTSFHRGQPDVAQLVPLPREIRDKGVQRYGFHGLSYEYIASALPSIAPAIARGRVVVAHLGSGASMCALKDGKSIDSTFGFTALDGLCMGTRPGALDPGVVLYLFQGLGLSVNDVESLLYKKAGLLGISGISNDMRALLGNDDPAARLAVDFFVYRAAKEVAAMATALGGIDGLVFTAGIGENSPEIRKRICTASAWLGIELDDDANSRKGPRISSQTSKVSAWVVPTNEELMIARHTAALLDLGGLGGQTPSQFVTCEGV
jgi:acetate kinase